MFRAHVLGLRVLCGGWSLGFQSDMSDRQRHVSLAVKVHQRNSWERSTDNRSEVKDKLGATRWFSADRHIEGLDDRRQDWPRCDTVSYHGTTPFS